METRYFDTLIKVIEAGSISRAAEALHITQSAASQRIKFLEERYGHRLLDRSGPTVVPTEAGRVVLEKARTIVELERLLRGDLRRLGTDKRLSLCCTPTFGMAYLPRIINDFVRRHSDVVDLKFVFSQPEQALKGLQEGQYDLAVIEHCGVDLAPFEVLPLPDDELVFISSPRLALPPSPLEVETLLPHRLYARRDGCSSKELLTQNLAAMGRGVGDFANVVISDDLRFSIEAVAAGDGVSFVSRSLVEEPLADGRLCLHRVQGFRHVRCRSAVRAKRRRASDGVSSLAEDFMESLLPAVSAGSAADRRRKIDESVLDSNQVHGPTGVPVSGF